MPDRSYTRLRTRKSILTLTVLRVAIQVLSVFPGTIISPIGRGGIRAGPVTASDPCVAVAAARTPRAPRGPRTINWIRGNLGFKLKLGSLWSNLGIRASSVSPWLAQSRRRPVDRPTLERRSLGFVSSDKGRRAENSSRLTFRRFVENGANLKSNFS